MRAPDFLMRNAAKDHGAFEMPIDDPYAPPKVRNGNDRAMTSMEEALRDLAKNVRSDPTVAHDVTPLQCIATMICELRYAEHKELATGLQCDPDIVLKWAQEHKKVLE